MREKNQPTPFSCDSWLNSVNSFLHYWRNVTLEPISSWSSPFNHEVNRCLASSFRPSCPGWPVRYLVSLLCSFLWFCFQDSTNSSKMNESILSPSFTLRLSCKQRRNSSKIPSFTLLLGLWSFSFTCPFCYGLLFFHYWPWTFFNSLTSPFLIELAGVESLFLIFSFLSQTVNEEIRNLNLLELFHKVKLFDWRTFTVKKMKCVES